jgi:hypothetical protein
LRESDEVLCDLLEDLLILIFVFKLQHVLDQIIAVGIFDQVVHVLDDVVGEL